MKINNYITIRSIINVTVNLHIWPRANSSTGAGQNQPGGGGGNSNHAQGLGHGQHVHGQQHVYASTGNPQAAVPVNVTMPRVRHVSSATPRVRHVRTVSPVRALTRVEPNMPRQVGGAVQHRNVNANVNIGRNVRPAADQAAGPRYRRHQGCNRIHFQN